MRVALLLCAAVLAAGCTASTPPLSPHHAAPALQSSPSPPNVGTTCRDCVACVPSFHVYAQGRDSADGYEALRWHALPASQRNASVESDLAAALRHPWIRPASREAAEAYLAILHGTWDYQHGGPPHPEASAQSPVLVDFGQGYVLVGLGVSVCAPTP